MDSTKIVPGITDDDLRDLFDEIKPPSPPDSAFTASEFAQANELSTSRASAVLNKSVANGILEMAKFHNGDRLIKYYWKRK